MREERSCPGNHITNQCQFEFEMSTPNPLIPQGTFQAQAARGASNVRLAVATIVAIHVVFFGGLLLQGCKRDTQLAQNTETATNAETSTNLALPPIESLYYNSSTNLPSETGSTLATPSGAGTNAFATPTSTESTQDEMWRATNLSTAAPGLTAEQASGAMKEYTVVARDSFSKIALAHKTTVRALRAANPNVEPTRIKPGDKINIPEPAPQTAAADQTGGLAPAGADGGTTIYTVKSGDSLSKIARNHGITMRQLSAANNLKTSGIKAGQKLKIPAPNPAQASNGTNLQRAPGL
jgi:LysM repeat protein